MRQNIGTYSAGFIPFTDQVADNADMALLIGKMGNGYYDGKLDEVRVSSVARSYDWIATEYNNRYNPATFY